LALGVHDHEWRVCWVKLRSGSLLIQVEASLIDKIREFASILGVTMGNYFSCNEKQMLRRMQK
jgi:hypothetical protein